MILVVYSADLRCYACQYLRALKTEELVVPASQSLECEKVQIDCIDASARGVQTGKKV